jgi:hypothetical protein
MSDPVSASEIRERATQLVERLDFVHAHPAYEAVWSTAMLCLGPYLGPKYKDELEALRLALLASRETPRQAEEEKDADE